MEEPDANPAKRKNQGVIPDASTSTPDIVTISSDKDNASSAPKKKARKTKSSKVSEKQSVVKAPCTSKPKAPRPARKSGQSWDTLLHDCPKATENLPCEQCQLTVTSKDVAVLKCHCGSSVKLHEGRVNNATAHWKTCK